MVCLWVCNCAWAGGALRALWRYCICVHASHTFAPGSEVDTVLRVHVCVSAKGERDTEKNESQRGKVREENGGGG